MLILAFAMILHPDACQPVTSSWIVAGDLARIEPAFESIPPATKITAAPIPGQRRVLKAEEIVRLAANHGIQLHSTTSVCFTFRTALLASDALRKSMEASLAGRATEIQILDQCAIPAPDGKLVFPLSGLSGFGPKPAIWRGYVEYEQGKRFYTWARVLVTVHEKHIVTNGGIKAGERIDRAQIQIEDYSGPLLREPALSDLSSVLGKIARYDIAAGAAVVDSELDTAPEVSRGELISVIAISGPATIESHGLAEQSGKVGDVISIRNPQSGKIYRGRVQRGGTAVVVSGGFFGIVPGDEKS